jgi:hypothetical protein
MKPVRGLLRAKEMTPLKQVPIGGEAGTPLTHRPMDPLRWAAAAEPLHHRGLGVFV